MRVLTGVQPTGRLHLGNYFGVVRPCLELQHEHDSAYLLANLHALTAVNDAAQLRQWTLDTALDLLALGLDPSCCALYLQSDVPEVTQLTWLLSVVTPVDLLTEAEGYKDKTGTEGFSSTCALLSYPVLMAADILVSDAECVVVGADQAQHVEICRQLASEFNRRFGEVFAIPRLHVIESVGSVPGTDGVAKMSKHTDNAIEVFETLASIEQRLATVTDAGGTSLEEMPLFRLYSLFASTEECDRMAASGAGLPELKAAFLSKVATTFADARARRARLEGRPDFVERVLENGAHRIRSRACHVLTRAYRAVGVLSPDQIDSERALRPALRHGGLRYEAPFAVGYGAAPHR